MDDQKLLRDFVEQKSQKAFFELSQKYTSLVYSTCLRELGSVEMAEDATQVVFLLLARKARSLEGRPDLLSWLFYASRLAARNILKQERRRVHREQKKREVVIEQDKEPEWNTMEAMLNDALAHLKPLDREAILLRYFEERTFAEVGIALSASEEGARKRVGRALKRMHTYLSRNSVELSLSGLVALFGIHARKTAPMQCRAAISNIASNFDHWSSIAISTKPDILHATQGVLKSMTISKIKAVATIVGTLGMAAGVLFQISSAAKSVKPARPVLPSIGMKKGVKTDDRHPEKWNGGNWSSWEPLSINGKSKDVDASIRETDLMPNGHGDWSGRFRNRNAKDVKIKVRCYYTDHRGEEQDSTFTFFVGGKSTSGEIKDMIDTSYRPIRVELVQFSDAY